MTRDPRKDPKPGDRFMKNEAVVTIITTAYQSISFTFCGKLRDAPPMVPWHEPWLPPSVSGQKTRR